MLLFSVALLLLAFHECGHILSTLLLGGRVQGLVFRGFAVGVALDLTPLSPRHQRWTVAAGPAAEWLLAAALVAAAHWGFLTPAVAGWACLMLAGDTALNLGPWWPANDGGRLRHHSFS